MQKRKNKAHGHKQRMRLTEEDIHARADHSTYSHVGLVWYKTVRVLVKR